MNTNVMPSIVKIDKENLKNLVNEVKETVVTDMNLQAPVINNKKFGIVDLWNIQSTMRTAASLRKN